MIEGTIFIGAIIIAITQFIKQVTPDKVNSKFTIPIAVAVGVAIALADTHIGVVNITVAQGIMIALGAVGVHTTASRIGETSG